MVAALAVLAAGCSASSGGDTATSTTSNVPTQKQNTSLNAKLPDAVRKAGVVKIGTEALYPPFESFGADNKTIVGLDPDMANALGQVLGVKVTMTHTAFDGLLTALDGGRFDLVMAAITDTKARQAKYDFADYFTTGQAIVVKKGNPAGIKDVADLCGKKVSALTASTQEKLLGAVQHRRVRGQQDQGDGAAQRQGRPAAGAHRTGRRRNTPRTRSVATTRRPSAVATSSRSRTPRRCCRRPVGIVFAKGSTQLRDAFKAALEEIIANGTYEKILAKNDLAGGAVKDVVINGGTS